MEKEKYTNITKYAEVQIQESEIVSFNKYDKITRSFRVYQDGFVGIHYQQGEMSDEEGYALAEKNLELKRDYPFELCGGERSLDKTEKLLSDTELLKKAKTELSWLRRNFPDFTFNGSVFYNSMSFLQENTAGMNYSVKDGHNGIGFGFKHKDSKDLDDGNFSTNMRTYSSAKFRKMAANYLTNFTKIVEMPKECIIMMPNWNFNSKLISSLDAEELALGTSLLSGKIGKKVFSEKLTLMHDVSKTNIWMSSFWDAEGVVQKNDRLTYIKNGKILRGYADKRIAQKYGVENTGSARFNWADVPQNGWINARIKPINKKPKQILQDLSIPFAILPVYYSGGGFKENGEYAMPVQMAYLTDGETILGKLPPFTMKSNLFDMFGKDFIGVSKYDSLWNAGMMIVKMEKGDL